MLWLLVAYATLQALHQVASSKERREHARSIISELQTAVSRSRRIYRAAFSSEKLVCGVVVWSRSSMGTAEEDWGVQAALSALSNERWIAPYIGGSPGISASAPWMIMLPVWRSQLFINALVSEHKRATSGYQRGQRQLTADPRWGRQPLVE